MAGRPFVCSSVTPGLPERRVISIVSPFFSGTPPNVIVGALQESLAETL